MTKTVLIKTLLDLGYARSQKDSDVLMLGTPMANISVGCLKTQVIILIRFADLTIADLRMNYNDIEIDDYKIQAGSQKINHFWFRKIITGEEDGSWKV